MLRRLVAVSLNLRLKRQSKIVSSLTNKAVFLSPPEHKVRHASSTPISPVQITHLDHLVLTVRDINKTVEFYTQVLGMELSIFKGGRKALNFGRQKINLHELNKEFEPKAYTPAPGSADLCFITETSLDEVLRHLQVNNLQIIEGPVERTGAVGPIKSVYIRDPDGNLIEISNYIC